MMNGNGTLVACGLEGMVLELIDKYEFLLNFLYDQSLASQLAANSQIVLGS